MQTAIATVPASLGRSNPALRERRFGFAHFHLGDVAAELESGGRDRGLELFGLRFHLGFVSVGPDPDEFVLRPIHPGADDGYADLFVQRLDVLLEVLQKIVHLALVDRVNANLRNHFTSSRFAEISRRSNGVPWKLSESLVCSQPMRDRLASC